MMVIEYRPHHRSATDHQHTNEFHSDMGKRHDDKERINPQRIESCLAMRNGLGDRPSGKAPPLPRAGTGRIGHAAGRKALAIAIPSTGRIGSGAKPCRTLDRQPGIEHTGFIERPSDDL